MKMLGRNLGGIVLALLGLSRVATADELRLLAVDNSGAILPGAGVTVAAADFKKHGTTAANGWLIIPGLEGSYSVKVDLQSFEPVAIGRVRVCGKGVTAIQATLLVEESAEKIITTDEDGLFIAPDASEPRRPEPPSREIFSAPDIEVGPVRISLCRPKR